MLDALFEQATEGIIVADASGEIIMSNPKALKMFGYKEGELNGNKIEVLIPNKIKHHHVGLRESYMKNPHNRSMGSGMDLFAKRKDNTEFPVEISLSHFRMQDANYVMSFIIDITSRKTQETDLKLAKERLQQTTDALSKLNSELEHKVNERTEELAIAIKSLAESKTKVIEALEKERELNVLKSRFVTTASHEFRTPLGTILSSASLLARYNNEQDLEKRMRHIERIKSSVANMTEILNDFLSLDKLEEGIIRNNPVDFNLIELIEKTSEDLRSILKNGQTLEVLCDVQEIQLHLDQQLIKNIIINLVSNAIKYSPEEKPILITIKDYPNKTELSVADQGIGIPEEDQLHLFDRFFRANNSGNIQGTGLGLNIVKKYTELIGAEISFKSKINEGSVFTVKFPKK